MQFLIDGYNLLFRYSGDLQQLQKFRRQLLEQLNRDAIRLHLQLTVVFDGPKGDENLERGHFHSLEVIFTGSRETADERIVKLLQEAAKPEKIVVVTSDRELRDKCVALRGKVEGGREFIARCLKKRPKKKPKPQKSLTPLPPSSPSTEESLFDYYLKAFGHAEAVPVSDRARWLAFFEQERDDEHPF